MKCLVYFKRLSIKIVIFTKFKVAFFKRPHFVYSINLLLFIRKKIEGYIKQYKTIPTANNPWFVNVTAKHM